MMKSEAIAFTLDNCTNWSNIPSISEILIAFILYPPMMWLWLPSCYMVGGSAAYLLVHVRLFQKVLLVMWPSVD